MNSKNELMEFIWLVQKAAVLQNQSPVISPQMLADMATDTDEMQKLKFRLQDMLGSRKRRYYFFLSFSFRAVIFFFISALIVGYITYLFDMHIKGPAEDSYYQSMFRTMAVIALIPAVLSSLMPYIHCKKRDYEINNIVSMNLFPYRIIFRTSKIMKFGIVMSFILLAISFLAESRTILKIANYSITGLFVVVATHFAWHRAIKREQSEHSRIFDWDSNEDFLPNELVKRKDITIVLYNIGVFLIYLAFTLFVLFVVKPMVETDMLHSPLFKVETYRTAFSHPLFWLFIFGFILRIGAFFRSSAYTKQK